MNVTRFNRDLAAALAVDLDIAALDLEILAGGGTGTLTPPVALVFAGDPSEHEAANGVFTFPTEIEIHTIPTETTEAAASALTLAVDGKMTVAWLIANLSGWHFYDVRGLASTLETTEGRRVENLAFDLTAYEKE